MTVTINGAIGITVPQGASQVQAEAGTDNTVLMTPLRTAQAIAALAGGTVNYQVFTSSGTWTKPANCKVVYVELWGGGGGGSGSSSYGTGGGGGGFISRVFRASDLSATVSVTVGAGGAGGSGAGGSGGSSSFGSASVRGGSGSADIAGGFGGGGEPGGYRTGGIDLLPVGSISGGGGGISSINRDGANAIYGGAGGGGSGPSFNGNGGVSSYGGNGGNFNQNGAPPGGGGGGRNGTVGGVGNGARGEVRVWAW